MTSPPAPQGRTALRVGFVPGVTPDKWRRIWAERVPDVRLELLRVEQAEQTAALHDGRLDLCLVRLPAHTEGLHLIPLYEELFVVLAPRGHFVEAADEVSVADLADEHLLQHPDEVPEWRAVSTTVRDGTRPQVPPLTTAQAVETVAAGVGIVIVPMSVARLHARKDVVQRPLTDVAPSPVGLAWRTEDSGDESVETFIGIVRGRRATSSRGPGAVSTAAAPRGGSGRRKGAAQGRERGADRRNRRRGGRRR